MRRRTDTVPHYDINALRGNVRQCQQNIARFEAITLRKNASVEEVITFREAILKESDTKRELERLMKEIEKEGQ